MAWQHKKHFFLFKVFSAPRPFVGGNLSENQACMLAVPRHIFMFHQTSFFNVCRLPQTATLKHSGSSSVTFDAGATAQVQSSRRVLDEVSVTPTSTIVVAHLGFNVNGQPSNLVDAGTTQVRVSSTSSGEVSERGQCRRHSSSPRVFGRRLRRARRAGHKTYHTREVTADET